jgi:acetamidase/formamidase
VVPPSSNIVVPDPLAAQRRTRMLACGAALIASAAVAGAQQVHRLDPSPTTVTWGYYEASVRPALTVRSGDTVVVRSLLGLDPRVLEAHGATADPMVAEIYRNVTKGPGSHMLTGPIFVEAARPGDVLEVEIQRIDLTLPYAYNRFRPGAGLLAADYPYTVLRIVPLDRERGVARVAPEVEVPLRPFFGSIGVAPPPEAGRLNSGPPSFHGGNLDNKELTAGSRLFLPVHVAGALVWFGDGHAAQGNGEVNLTALETGLEGTVRLVVHTGRRLRWPRAETPSSYITMGLDEDLERAVEVAVREMIDFLVTEKGLSRDDAYILCSIAGDLSVTQVVDGTKGVHMSMPKAVFTGAKPKAGSQPKTGSRAGG